METYTEKEIKHIKAQEWDKGWKWGLLAATILWVGTAIIVRVFFL